MWRLLAGCAEAAIESLRGGRDAEDVLGGGAAVSLGSGGAGNDISSRFKAGSGGSDCLRGEVSVMLGKALSDEARLLFRLGADVLLFALCICRSNGSSG